MNSFQDLIKLQVMSNITTTRTAGGASRMTMVDVFIQVVLMFFMGIVEDLCKALPAFVETVKNKWSGQLKRRITDVLPAQDEPLTTKSILLDKRHSVNCVRMMRIYSSDKSSSSSGGSSSADSASAAEMNHRVDAILAFVAHLDNIPTMQLIPNGHFMVSYKDKPIQITKDIYMKIDNIQNHPNTGHITSISISLISNTISASDISQYVENLYTTYQEELKNSLGKNIYFFDQKYKDTMPPRMPAGGASAENIATHRRMLIQTAPKQLNFTMTPFYSNKRFNNIFGTDVRKVQSRVEFFLNNREWYDRKGIPYQLGVMLSGLPGTGKTSIIRAIANLTKRHIINVNFGNITTATQLKNLFYNERLEVYTDCTFSETKSYFIPMDQRLYVLEEIDAVSDILKQRGGDDQAAEESIPDQLTLGEILTVLDGTMEIPGRMIIMTSNHPEFLDKALLRPGRIDVNAKFGNATRELIAEMFQEYLEIPFPADRVCELPNELLTPAEASEVIMRYCKSADIDIDLIIREMLSVKGVTYVPKNYDNTVDVKSVVSKEETVAEPLLDIECSEAVQKNIDMTKKSVAHLENVATKFSGILNKKLNKDNKFTYNFYKELSYDNSLWTQYPTTMAAVSRVLVNVITQCRFENNLCTLITGIGDCLEVLQRLPADNDAKISDDINANCPPSFIELWNFLKKYDDIPAAEVSDVVVSENKKNQIDGIAPAKLYNTHMSVKPEESKKFNNIIRQYLKDDSKFLELLQKEFAYDEQLWSLYPMTMRHIADKYVNSIIWKHTNTASANPKHRYYYEKLAPCVLALQDVHWTDEIDHKIHAEIQKCDSLHTIHTAIRMYQKQNNQDTGAILGFDLNNPVESSYAFI